MKRVAALLIAVAVAATPVALEACQVTCTARPIHGLQTSDDHRSHHQVDTAESCHETAGTGRTLSAGSLPCDHGGTAASVSVITARTDTLATAAPVRVSTSDLPDAVRATFVACGWPVLPVNRLDLRLSVSLRI